jgi:dTDP-4-amino-4,6-dideoxygalactose transaminase
MKPKVSVADLALFGGPATFEDTLHVGRPNLGDREQFLARINTMLDRRWLTNDGPFVQEFEAEIAKLLDVKHCVAMCNATVALEIAIRALGMSGEVIVPSMTFVATAHALQWQGIVPVFADIDPATHNLDPAAVERMITPRTTGIIGVHLWGRACPIEELDSIGRKHNLRVLYDAAHAFNCSYRGRMIGNFGDAEVVSFHATKFFNTLEGGAVLTNNDELAHKVRLMKNFGFAGYDQVVYVGTNGKMNEASAAMGLSCLDSLEKIISINRANYCAYRQHLAGLPGVTLLDLPDDEVSNYQYVVLEIDEAQSGVSRDHLAKILWAENVRARRYFAPGCHRMEPYVSLFPHAGLLLPETERMVQRTLLMPTGTAVGEAEIAAVCQVMRWVVENGARVHDRFDTAASGVTLVRPD